MLLLAAPALAQEAGGAIDFGEVTITGTRVIKLPPARKGEVVDSSVYILPAKDTLLFGERISNFGGPGGALPGYREFDPPASAHGEASIGTFLSPRLMAHAEYNQRTFDLMGTVDYRGTAGHVDSAEASSLLFDVRGGVLLGGEDPTAPRVRITAGFDRIGDSYILYGNRLSPFDRSRTTMRINAALASAQDALLDYDLYFHLEHSSVDDTFSDSTVNAEASTPGFGVAIAAGNDTLRGRLGIDYQISSLHYGRSSTTPNWVAARLEGEWHINPKILLTVGGIYSGAQYSDSGSATLVSARAAMRWQATDDVTIFASFAPELRAASYRNRIMRAPYVDRQIALRPERVPINLGGGVRLATASTTLEGRVRFERAEQTPVVAADSSVPGSLRYVHVSSTRTLALGASLRTQFATTMGALFEAEIRSAVDSATDEQLPMVPQIDLRLRTDLALTRSLSLFATGRYESAQRVGLERDAREIPSRFLLDAGGSYALSPALGIFAEVTNLLGTTTQLWDGYTAPGLEIRGGARLTF
jgi:outer membrane receptor protein involved in Fe transport